MRSQRSCSSTLPPLSDDLTLCTSEFLNISQDIHARPLRPLYTSVVLHLALHSEDSLERYSSLTILVFQNELAECDQKHHIQLENLKDAYRIQVAKLDDWQNQRQNYLSSAIHSFNTVRDAVDGIWGMLSKEIFRNFADGNSVDVVSVHSISNHAEAIKYWVNSSEEIQNATASVRRLSYSGDIVHIMNARFVTVREGLDNILVCSFTAEHCPDIVHQPLAQTTCLLEAALHI